MIGPRDEKEGNTGLPLHGTNILISSDKRWAVITNATRNVDNPFQQKKSSDQMISRGHLVPSFVNSCVDPLVFIKDFDLRQLGNCYEGFNLLFGIGNKCAYFLSNRFPASSFERTKLVRNEFVRSCNLCIK